MSTAVAYAFWNISLARTSVAEGGALLYVVNEMFHIGRRLNSPAAMAWGLLPGFLLAYSTDLFLTYLAA